MWHTIKNVCELPVCCFYHWTVNIRLFDVRAKEDYINGIPFTLAITLNVVLRMLGCVDLIIDFHVYNL